MQPNNQSDEWLMGQVAAGRRDCLETLVRRYATPLLTYLTRMCGDRHRSEEVLQEVFFAVWNKRKTYKLDKPFKAWLFAIATNRCRSAFRAKKGKPMASLEENTDTSPESADGDPLAAAMKSENAGIVAAALAELPEHQRLVVTLRIWGGLSYAEIAASADRTEATVRSHMFRALESLRKSLAPALVQD